MDADPILHSASDAESSLVARLNVLRATTGLAECRAVLPEAEAVLESCARLADSAQRRFDEACEELDEKYPQCCVSLLCHPMHGARKADYTATVEPRHLDAQRLRQLHKEAQSVFTVISNEAQVLRTSHDA